MSNKLFKQLALLSEMTHAAPWEWSFSEKKLSVSGSFFNIFESSFTMTDLRLKSTISFLRKYLNEAQQYSLEEAVRTAKYDGTKFTLRFLIQTSKNRRKWIRLTGNPIRKNGETLKIEGVLQDISDLKFLEEEYEFTKLAIEKADVLIFRLQPDGKIDYVNEQVIQSLEISKETLSNQFFYDIEVHFNETGWQQHFKLLRRKSKLTESGFLMRKNKAVFPVEMDFTYFRHAEKEAVYVFLKDISKYKNQEKELAKAQTVITRLEAEKSVEEFDFSGTEFSNLFPKIISKNKGYQKILAQLAQVAPTDSTILILGETGTGKELLADAVHELSRRKDRPFVKVNCATLPEHLIESELFGHEKGAFTSAVKRRIGRFELANHGTIFLDEIAELPLDMQAKLLRVLQEGSFERIGGTETIRVDIRIVAATNRNLATMVAEGKFRRDLYYRLNVFPIENLPLRKRKDDIPLLVKYFLKKYSDRTKKQVNSVNKDTLHQLRNYDYPGNIRELENLIERGIVLAQSNVLKLDTITPEISNRVADFKSFDDMQRDYIIEALKLTNWRISGEYGAAKLLGLNPKTLESKMRKLGVKRPSF